MKHLKMLGLAAIAALGLMAFVGAGTASATTLFTNSAKTIKYPAETTLHLTIRAGTSMENKTTSGSVFGTCTGSTIQVPLSNETGTWVEGNISSFAWEGCNQTTDATANGKLKIMWISSANGEVVGVGSKWTYSIFGTTCTYGTGEGTKLGTIAGGEAPVLSISTNISKVEGNFLCPGSTIWLAEYVITSPHATYIGE